MNIENIISYLEENNLIENLSKKMYYMHFSNFRKVLGKSASADWLERVELFYTTKYYLNGREFFKEELSTIYDEWDYIGTISTSPIQTYTKKPFTKRGLVELLKKLPKEKIELLMRSLNIEEQEIQRLLNQTKETNNQSKEKIKKEKEIAELLKSIVDMQIALGTMVHIMGSQLTRSDIQNVSSITKKAKEYLNTLKEESKDLEEQTTLTLK